MILGFTGTRRGMTLPQRQAFHEFILKTTLDQFHHGDCVGADKQAHGFVRAFAPKCIIHVWPPENSKNRAFCEGDIVHTKLPYLERNKEIVYIAQLVIATPKGISPEQRGSGTWHAIRLCRTLNVNLLVIWPDGKTSSNVER